MIINGADRIHPASDFIAAPQREARSSELPFLNVDFRPRHPKASRPDLRGCGIYAIGFNGRLAYIGKFLGKCKQRKPEQNQSQDPFGGDVADARWWKHLSTSTLRGYNTATERTNVATAIRRLGELEPLPRLQAAGTAFARPAGCQASVNRIRFAAKHWDELNPEEADADAVLAKFTFIYARIEPGSIGGSVASIMGGIGAAEDGLIEQLRPPINDETHEWIPYSARPEMAGLGERLVAALEAQAGRINDP